MTYWYAIGSASTAPPPEASSVVSLTAPVATVVTTRSLRLREAETRCRVWLCWAIWTGVISAL